jgi:hypothetical protein
MVDAIIQAGCRGKSAAEFPARFPGQAGLAALISDCGRLNVLGWIMFVRERSRQVQE